MRWIALAALALLPLAGLAPRDAADARAAAFPQNFVSGLSCTRAPGTEGGDVIAGFSIPNAVDVYARFGRMPDQIWIDLSLFDNGFAPGTFIGAGPFTPAQGDAGRPFNWLHLIPSNMHYYRLNALFGSQWVEMGRGQFETPNCGAVASLGCMLDGSGLLVVNFSLPPASPIPGAVPQQQWLDLTLFANPRNPLLDNGFLPGTFIGAGPFPPGGIDIFSWSGIVSARRHYYRVNTLYSDSRWVQQFSGSFVTLDCRALPKLPLPLI
ncbi:MAG TPA: hypothetical protein VFC53_13965 [Dehalococcoidia bacterium]|nr:hypothetical protein [Dehalococcoidia bacterium]